MSLIAVIVLHCFACMPKNYALIVKSFCAFKCAFNDCQCNFSKKQQHKLFCFIIFSCIIECIQMTVVSVGAVNKPLFWYSMSCSSLAVCPLQHTQTHKTISIIILPFCRSSNGNNNNSKNCIANRQFVSISERI